MEGMGPDHDGIYTLKTIPVAPLSSPSLRPGLRHVRSLMKRCNRSFGDWTCLPLLAPLQAESAESSPVWGNDLKIYTQILLGMAVGIVLGLTVGPKSSF